MTIGVKRIIALSLVVSYILLICYSTVFDKLISDKFTNFVELIIAYYFGRGSVTEGDKL
jgi:hypothetical protein